MDKFDNSNFLKIGLLGGTFDPIHMGHIHIALQAKKHLSLDRVDFIVSKSHPFKENSVFLDAKKRFELLKEALSPYKNFLASSVEIDREGVSYSYLTAMDYKKLYPKSKLFWIMGSDAFSSITKWENYREFLNLVSLVLYPRDTEELWVTPENDSINSAEIIKLNEKTIDISSTKLKKLLENKENHSNTLVKLDGLIPNNIKGRVFQFYSS